MVKLAYFSDSHFRSRRPIRRLDDEFFLNQMKKFDEIVDFCISEKCQALIHGGDLFDVPLPDYGVYNAVARRFYSLLKAKIKCYITFGSHDLLGYQSSSVDKTGVGALIQSGLLHPLIGSQEVCGVLFYGVSALIHSTSDTYKTIPKSHIIVTHNIITSDPVAFEHVTFQDLAFDEEPRIFLCAHYHKAFQKQVKNLHFFSTGPLVRTDKQESEHEPNILCLDINSHSLKIEVKVLNYVKNVMDLTEKTELGSTCISGLKDTRITFFNLFELTKKIAKDNKVPEEVITSAIQRLEAAERGVSNV